MHSRKKKKLIICGFGEKRSKEAVQKIYQLLDQQGNGYNAEFEYAGCLGFLKPNGRQANIFNLSKYNKIYCLSRTAYFLLSSLMFLNERKVPIKYFDIKHNLNKKDMDYKTRNIANIVYRELSTA